MPTDVSAEAAFAGAPFWWLTLAFSLSSFVVTALAVHLVPYLQGEGFSAGLAAQVAGLVGVMALPGRLLFTPLGSVWPRHRVAAAIFGLQALGLLALNLPGGVWLFIALYGAGFGAITPARAALVAEAYGGAHCGRISGRLSLFNALARASAPVGIGVLYTVTGGYDAGMIGLTALSVLAALAVLFVREGTRRAPLERPS